MSIELDDHVGRTLLAMDLNGACSPTIQAILPNGVDLNDVVRDFNAAFTAFMDGYFPGEWEWVLDNGEPKFSLHGRSNVIKPREERIAEFSAMLARLHELQEKTPPKPPPTHEKDGTLGWWRVDGVRHDAIVKASSAAEAIDKAVKADAVGSWESPDADWIGEELPEVMSV